jgi:hypothetical protein
MNRPTAIVLALLIMLSAAGGGLVPPRSEQYIDLPGLLEESEVVCKGEVVDASPPKSVVGNIPRGTGVAVIQTDRCFKGSAPSEVRVATDEYVPSAGFGAGMPLFVPKVGEYGLFFFKSAGTIYKPVDGPAFIRTSRLVAANDPVAGPIERLEADFIEGLHDPDEELRLLTICWMGRLHRASPRATAKLREMLPSSDELQRLYIWEALLAVHDYSILPEAAAAVLRETAFPSARSFSMPQDRMAFMRYRVYDVICRTQDRVTIPYMRRLSASPDPRRRDDAVQSLRAQRDLASAPIFLRALGDQEGDNGFVAMQSLFDLAGQGPESEQIPGPEDFRSGTWAAEKIRQWWISTGEARAKLQPNR